MKYITASPAHRHRGYVLLEEGVTRASVSEECRFAALELMAGVARGWDKRDLAAWLTGPYACATRHDAHGERTRVGQRGPIDPGAIEDLLTTTRARQLAALENAALGDGSLDFAEGVVDRGFVGRALDDDGTEVWIPVDKPRMHLRDRLSSLFVADYLDDPASYENLFVCHLCESIVFDAAARRQGICSRHRHVSGIVAKTDPRADYDDVANED